MMMIIIIKIIVIIISRKSWTPDQSNAISQKQTRSPQLRQGKKNNNLALSKLELDLAVPVVAGISPLVLNSFCACTLKVVTGLVRATRARPVVQRACV